MDSLSELELLSARLRNSFLIRAKTGEPVARLPYADVAEEIADAIDREILQLRLHLS